ncbi:hypothetical protein CN315_19730 [Bacillus cereus]|nr:hypothetical protein CN337_08885 [Bacillus anthracis]PFF06204.1 hypothetical protein CN315_19730 [Bacillus cereus]PGK08121.1 hypothetical protein CN892_10655 [Bacillus anthracis]PGX55631.1 hypothetical protein COE12_10180 [Bacillus anthracis]
MYDVVHFFSSDVCFYPALTGSKTPTSKFSGSKEVRWERAARKSPIGSANNQWGMNKTPTD